MSNDKLTTLRNSGINPYPSSEGMWNQSIAHARRVELLADSNSVKIQVGGRIMFRNRMGKIVFLRIEDSSAKIQLMIVRPEVGEDMFNLANGFDIGDWVWCKGILTRTKAGELTIRVQEIRLASKCLEAFPDRQHGIVDQETCVRQRYLDLMMNSGSKEVFKLRSKIVSHIRRLLEDDDYLEVETSMLNAIPGGANAKPFMTHHNALDTDFYLRIAPELALKRLIVGGFEKVFEIGKNFRNEGVSTRHNPEFTSCEFYAAWNTYEDLISFVHSMLKELSKISNPLNLDFEPLRVVSMESLISTAVGMADIRDPVAWSAWWNTNKPDKKNPEFKTFGKWWELIFEEIEPTLIDPTFVVGYPAEISPLARRSNSDPEIAERFELFICGKEIANGFNELNDPEVQAACFEEQMKAKNAGDEEGMYYDADYITALRYGMPPVAGCGIGIDRLVMVFAGKQSIREVILYPAVKPEIHNDG